MFEYQMSRRQRYTNDKYRFKEYTEHADDKPTVNGPGLMPDFKFTPKMGKSYWKNS